MARVTKPGRGRGRWSHRPGLAKSHRSRTHNTAKIAKVGPAREGAGLAFWGVGQNRQKKLGQKDDNIVTLPARNGPKKPGKCPKKPGLGHVWPGFGPAWEAYTISKQIVDTLPRKRYNYSINTRHFWRAFSAVLSLHPGKSPYLVKKTCEICGGTKASAGPLSGREAADLICANRQVPTARPRQGGTAGAAGLSR